MMEQQVITKAESRYENWLEVLDTFGVRFLILDAWRDRGLVQAARSHPAWAVDLEEGDSILFTRLLQHETGQAAA